MSIGQSLSAVLRILDPRRLFSRDGLCLYSQILSFKPTLAPREGIPSAQGRALLWCSRMKGHPKSHLCFFPGKSSETPFCPHSDTPSLEGLKTLQALINFDESPKGYGKYLAAFPRPVLEGNSSALRLAWHRLHKTVHM